MMWLFFIIKMKYGFYEKCQGGFKELHFSLDNMFKGTKIRVKYQKVIQILVYFGEIYGGSK